MTDGDALTDHETGINLAEALIIPLPLLFLNRSLVESTHLKFERIQQNCLLILQKHVKAMKTITPL